MIIHGYYIHEGPFPARLASPVVRSGMNKNTTADQLLENCERIRNAWQEAGHTWTDKRRK